MYLLFVLTFHLITLLLNLSCMALDWLQIRSTLSRNNSIFSFLLFFLLLFFLLLVFFSYLTEVHNCIAFIYALIRNTIRPIIWHSPVFSQAKHSSLPFYPFHYRPYDQLVSLLLYFSSLLFKASTYYYSPILFFLFLSFTAFRSSSFWCLQMAYRDQTRRALERH